MEEVRNILVSLNRIYSEMPQEGAVQLTQNKMDYFSSAEKWDKESVFLPWALLWDKKH